MAGELQIPTGTRLNIAYDVPVGQDPDFSLFCTFNKAIDESAFMISIPMKSGKPLVMDENQKLLIKYGAGDDIMIIAGYVDDEVRQGIRRYWKIRRVSEQRQFFQRSDERVKISLNTTYLQETWPLNADGKIEKETGMTLDVSAGGAAVFLNRRFDVGEYCAFDFPRVGTSEEGKAVEGLVSQVCWLREAPKGSIYRYICGIQFRFGGNEKDLMKRYVGNLKKKFRID